MGLEIRRLGPPFTPHKLSFMEREVPPPSKNKTRENCFHSSEGPNPVGRCRPAALPPFQQEQSFLSGLLDRSPDPRAFVFLLIAKFCGQDAATRQKYDST